MKFKVGDMVKVKEDCKMDDSRWVGRAGVMKDVEKGLPYPYTVEFGAATTMVFTADELEKGVKTDDTSTISSG